MIPRPQWRLRSMLVLFAMLGSILAIAMQDVRAVRRRNSLVASLLAHGCEATINGWNVGAAQKPLTVRILGLDDPFERYNFVRFKSPEACRELTNSLVHLPKLRTIILEGDGTADELLQRVPLMPGLQSLHCNSLDLKPESLRHIGRLPGLTHLTIHSHACDESSMKSIRELKELSSLTIAGAHFVDWGIDWGWVSDNRRLTAVGLSHIAKLTNLEHLDLRGMNIDVDGLKHFARLTRLKTLQLQYSDAGDDLIEVVSQLPSIEELDLSRTLITDSGVGMLRRLERLHKLNITWTKVSARSAFLLGEMKSVKTVRFDRTLLLPYAGMIWGYVNRGDAYRCYTLSELNRVDPTVAPAPEGEMIP